MVWLAKLTTGPQTWFATGADGYRPTKDELTRIHRAYPSLARHQGVLEDADQYFAALVATRQAAYPQEHPEEAATPSPCGECDLFAIRLDLRYTPDPQHPFRPIYDELSRDDTSHAYLQIVLIEPGCENANACLREACETLKFRLKTEPEYHDYPAFQQAAERLYLEMLRAYVSPRAFAEAALEGPGCRFASYY